MVATTHRRPSSAAASATLDPVLLALAQAQSGVLTTAQLRSAGHTSRRLVGLVATGVLRHPGRGLYVVGRMEESEPVARHRQLTAGALLLYPDALLVGVTALLAHDVDVWGVDLSRPCLRRPMCRSGGMSAFWVRQAPGDAVETAWGPASPVADALVQNAVDWGIVPGVVSADASLRASKTTADELATAVDRVCTQPRGSRAVAMGVFADGRRESVGESRCGVALAMAGFDVTPQVEIRDAAGRVVARVDFLVDDTPVVVEFDGKVKYADGDPEVLWREKQREDRLRALGYVVVRITWADLERPGAVAARVRAALRRSA
jgi:very-short-patch-repair endonuclease